MMRLLIIAAAVLWCSTAHALLPASVQALLNKYGIADSGVSVVVSEVSTGGGAATPILLQNERVPRNPASVLKLVTTMAALDLLGPTYQWKTRYYLDGERSGDTLKGNLVMQGGGDPFLSVDRLWSHVLAIRERGIRQIDGALILDNSLFTLPRHDRGAFDGKPARLYNVGPDATLTNFSATRFVLEPTTVGGVTSINVFADPPLANLVVQNNLATEPGKCVSRNSGWSMDLQRQGEKVTAVFTGKYRPRCRIHSISRSILPNTEYTYQLFRYLWESMGGTLSGGFRVGPTPEDATLLVTLSSRSLAENIASINKYSNNVMARQLLLTIGQARQEIDRKAFEKDSTRPAPIVDTRIAGVETVRGWLDRNGINGNGLVIDNGSGLSRISRLSAGQISQLLDIAWRSTWQPEFLSSLSLAALDGTMRKRLRKSPIKGRARIKTGLVKGVRSMAGYVHARSGKHYLVTMMIDSSKVNYWNGNQVQDALLEWVYAR